MLSLLCGVRVPAHLVSQERGVQQRSHSAAFPRGPFSPPDKTLSVAIEGSVDEAKALFKPPEDSQGNMVNRILTKDIRSLPRFQSFEKWLDWGCLAGVSGWAQESSVPESPVQPLDFSPATH